MVALCTAEERVAALPFPPPLAFLGTAVHLFPLMLVMKAPGGRFAFVDMVEKAFYGGESSRAREKSKSIKERETWNKYKKKSLGTNEEEAGL